MWENRRLQQRTSHKHADHHISRPRVCNGVAAEWLYIGTNEWSVECGVWSITVDLTAHIPPVSRPLSRQAGSCRIRLASEIVLVNVYLTSSRDSGDQWHETSRRRKSMAAAAQGGNRNSTASRVTRLADSKRFCSSSLNIARITP